MRDETITQLRKISTPKQFMQNDYICYEGQPGNEMYIILKGMVGIYITSTIGTLTQVAKIQTGDFFGEMAIFDNLPRSASCIALEDTIVVAITQDNLQQLLAACPEIARQMLENMSGRIRKLDAELYQNNRFVKNRHVPKFTIPTVCLKEHAVKEPYQDPKIVAEYKQACPICAKAVTVTGMRRIIMKERSFDVDCRINYVGCDPLWTDVISCPYCYYTNHYLRFFRINNFEFEVVQRILQKEHKPIVEARMARRSEFDLLVMRYLQAIHINEHIDPGANALIGGLWRNLYWLAKDVEDSELALYCAKRAVQKYKIAVDESQFFDSASKAATALSLANLMAYCKDGKEVMHYIDIAIESQDEKISTMAVQIKLLLEKRLTEKNK